MRFILNVIDTKFCAQVLVIAEEDEKGFDLPIGQKSCPTRCIKIWHNNVVQSMVPATEPKLYDNDTFVTFKTNVSYHDFCTEFNSSSYNLPGAYHTFDHNCANAALEACRIAKIDLPINLFFRLSRLTQHSFFRFPPIMLTPADLYQHAKAQKVKLLNEPNSSYARLLLQMQEVKTELKSGAWRNTKTSAIINDAEIILSEINYSMLMRPYHVELYFRVLSLGINLIKHKADDSNDYTEHQEYAEFSEQFKEREQSPFTRLFNQEIALIFGYFLYIGIKPAIKSLCMVDEKTGISNGNFVVSIINAMFLGLWMLITGKILYEKHYHKKSDPKPTRLSKTMNDLIEHVIDSEPEENLLGTGKRMNPSRI